MNALTRDVLIGTGPGVLWAAVLLIRYRVTGR
jgi:hypothetical protein